MIITINRPMDIEVNTLNVDSHIRYFEDCDICLNHQWVEDDEHNPKMPCMELVNMGRYSEYRWRPIIDIDSGQIINWTKGVQARTYYKVCDEFKCTIMSNNGEDLITYEGYVPDFMAIDDSGYGDYIYLTINEDGYIKNWRLQQSDIELLEEYNIN